MSIDQGDLFGREWPLTTAREPSHTCHWPGCPLEVPPAMWGCRAHWYMLPLELRNRVWATYVPGQEITKTPGLDYVLTAAAVQDWIRRRGTG